MMRSYPDDFTAYFAGRRAVAAPTSIPLVAV
jgi:hypothetical protein